eukprot:scaffold8106_cov403-Prasinococcus_capsulatus_cf.AAC.1
MAYTGWPCLDVRAARGRGAEECIETPLTPHDSTVWVIQAPRPAICRSCSGHASLWSSNVPAPGIYIAALS